MCPRGGQLHGGQGGQKNANSARYEGNELEDEAAEVERTCKDDGAQDAAEIGGPPSGIVEEAVDAPKGGCG